LNLTITDVNPANITYNWNGTNTTYYRNYSNLTSLGDGNWTFLLNQSGLVIGQTYTYYLVIRDFAGNANTTELRFVKGNVAPAIVSLVYSPTTNDTIDPGVMFNVTINVSDTDNNFDQAILQWKNVSQNWSDAVNSSMNNLTEKGFYTLMNVNFTLPSYETNMTWRIFLNDSTGDSNYSNNYTFYVLWDCNWTLDKRDLGAFAGWNENKKIGNITVLNIGDPEYSDNNCSLDFRLTYNLAQGRIYINGSYYKPSSTFSVNAEKNSTLFINATFLSELRQDNAVITTMEISDRSVTEELNTTAVLISNEAGPYLYQEITSYPAAVYLTSGDISLGGYLRNLMGDDTENNTAYNVTFNWSLPSGLGVSEGNETMFYENISDSDVYGNDINATFSDLGSMSPGTKTISLYAQGYNISGELIEDANNNTLLTETTNITFICYNASDGICVIACGYTQDSDCEVPPSGNPSGGGGGSGGGGKVIESEAEYYLIRGEELNFTFVIENKFNYSLSDISINVEGINSRYIEIVNSSSSIKSNSSMPILVKITAPSYFPVGVYDLIFTINAQIDTGTKTSYTEKRKITIHVLEISEEQAKKLLEEARGMVKDMHNQEMYTKDVLSMLGKIEISYKDKDFLNLKSLFEQLKKIYNSALESKGILEELKVDVNKAEKEGLKVLETKKILYMAEIAFKRGDFLLALEKLKEARLTFAIETKGEFNLLKDIINRPLQYLAGIFLIFLVSLSSGLALKLRLYKRKLRLLEEEEKLLLQLMKVIQRDCFEKNKMSIDQYGRAMMQYETRLSETIEDKIKVETKIENLLKIKPKKRILEEEKLKLINLIKELQNKYLIKGKIETRIYQNMLRSYSSRLSEIEEQIAFAEADEALQSLNWFNTLKRKILKKKKHR